MTAAAYKLTIEQGANFNLALTWLDPNRAPINLTGYTAEMRVALNKGGALVLNPTTENDQIVLGGVLGTILVNVPAADTLELDPGQYVYEIDLTSPDAQVTRLLASGLVVTGKV